MLQALPFFEPKEQQSILSVGTGGALWEVLLASHWPSSNWTLLEPKKDSLNEETITETIDYWAKKHPLTNPASFTIINEPFLRSVLPKASFDRIFFFNSLHEMEDLSQVLHKAYELLTFGGLVLIEEQLAQTKGEIHEGCGKELFTFDTLVLLTSSTSLSFESYQNNHFKFNKLK
jgi:ubiquinone/menaquinone biosynthesis C-methylase UbiE